MKRIVIMFLLIVQFLCLLQNLLTEKKLNTGEIFVTEFRGYSSLLKVVYSNFLESLKNLIKVGILFNSNLPKKEDEQERNSTSANNQIYFCNNFSNFVKIIKRSAYNIEVSKNFGISNALLYSNYRFGFLCIFVSFLFWYYLYKLKFYYLKPRSTIDDILIYILNINPIIICPYQKGQVVMGFFYFMLVI